MDQKNQACYAGLVHLMNEEGREFVVSAVTICFVVSVAHFIFGMKMPTESTALKAVIVTATIPFFIVTGYAVSRFTRFVLRHLEQNASEHETEDQLKPPP